jgi:hypothetical protein
MKAAIGSCHYRCDWSENPDSRSSVVTGNLAERHLFKIPRYLAVVACEPFKQPPLFKIRRRAGYQIAFYGLSEQPFDFGLEVLHGQVPPLQC